jgi:hypothetical protein
MERMKMTSKAEFKKRYADRFPAEYESAAAFRRARLNELGATPEKDDDQTREHDALAEMVAVDEETEAEEVKGDLPS